MPNADLTRREKPCPTCGGSGRERKRFLLSGGRWTDAGECPECEGGFIPAETPEEYAARLVELVEQARRERDNWKAMAHYMAHKAAEYECKLPFRDPERLRRKVAFTTDIILAEAARAVAGKEKS